MSIDFHAEENKYTYAAREADEDWIRTMASIVDPRDKRVADIGCGGGIYTREWARAGVAEAIGVDFAEPQLQAAREMSKNFAKVSYRQGSALSTRLEDQSVDIVLERALIHHDVDLGATFREAYRVLKTLGVLIIQDRTMDDVQIAGSPDHIRGYFFECFPKLLAFEASRRAQAEAIGASLRDVGFQNVEMRLLWEVRRTFRDFTELAADLMARTGRSILHELTDAELADLVQFIRKQLPADVAIIDKDRWTVWSAVKRLNVGQAELMSSSV